MAGVADGMVLPDGVHVSDVLPVADSECETLLVADLSDALGVPADDELPVPVGAAVPVELLEAVPVPVALELN